MDTSVLEDIGLSQIEVKLFLTILELGESKAGKIIGKSGLQSSSAYNAINALITKGLVSYIKKSEVKYYRAADPEAVLEYIDLKKNEYLKILPELKARQKKSEEEGVEFFKSFKGIKTLMIKMLKDAKKGDTYMNIAIEDSEQYKIAREKVFFPIKHLTSQKKLIMKGIFSEKNRYPSTKSSKMQKRYIDEPLPPNTLVVNNKVAIISWGDEPSGILIHSREIYNKYVKFFEHLWATGKR